VEYVATGVGVSGEEVMIKQIGVSGVEFRVLGPVEALIEGRPIDLGPPKRRLLLALLLLEGGRPFRLRS